MKSFSLYFVFISSNEISHRTLQKITLFESSGTETLIQRFPMNGQKQFISHINVHIAFNKRCQELLLLKHFTMEKGKISTDFVVFSGSYDSDKQ